MENRRKTLKLIAVCACMTAAAAIISACSEKAPGFAAIDITGADYARDFALTDHNGQARSLKDFAGKVVVMFFGYVHCPDVCPTAMTELAQAKKLLGKDGERLQGLFVSVDPERDTPEVLKAYMAAFDPTFLALYTTPEKLQALAKDYRIYYKKVDGPTPTSYSIDHTAGNYVYDPQGKLRLYTQYGSGAAQLAADIRLLLKEKT
jgi:protein SCO1/2